MPDWLVPLLVAPFVGSFLGVLIRRLPTGGAVVNARSTCERCGRVLRPVELVPLASFLVQRGRCRGCGGRIAPFHPVVELAALAVSGAAAMAGTDGPRFWAGCALGWTLLVLAWIDWQHMILPDVLTLPLMLAGVALALLWPEAALPSAPEAVLGVVLGYLAFRLVALLYRRLRGREGLGAGDAKLLAAAGAWLGAQALPGVVLLAALSALALALLAGARGARLSATLAIPFGPPLAVAIWLAWLFPGLVAWL
ncbi:MAG: prepilin peptidase [Alphaproteobacteria bacterium]|nr:prepilin peptidase [Alphaproteobacteria bacterium]